MLLQVLRQQLLDKVAADDVSRFEIAQAIPRQVLQVFVGLKPHPERQPEAMFFLGNNIVWQKSPQRLLEEVAQLRPLKLQVRFESQGKGNDLIADKRKRHIHSR